MDHNDHSSFTQEVSGIRLTISISTILFADIISCFPKMLLATLHKYGTNNFFFFKCLLISVFVVFQLLHLNPAWTEPALISKLEQIRYVFPFSFVMTVFSKLRQVILLLRLNVESHLQHFIFAKYKPNGSTMITSWRLSINM